MGVPLDQNHQSFATIPISKPLQQHLFLKLQSLFNNEFSFHTFHTKKKKNFPSTPRKPNNKNQIQIGIWRNF